MRSEAIAVEVSPGQAPAPDAKVGSGEDVEPDEPDELAPLFTPETLPRHQSKERWLTPERWLVGMLAAPAFLGVGAGASLLWRRFGPDERARRRSQERARHRHQLEAARSAVESGDGFHARLAQLCQEIALARAGTAGVGLPRPELLRLLRERGVTEQDVERLRTLLDRCDAARFGADHGSREQREALLADAEQLMRSSLAKGVA